MASTDGKGNGFNSAQMRILGEYPCKGGWKQRAMKKGFTYDAVTEFISLTGKKGGKKKLPKNMKATTIVINSLTKQDWNEFQRACVQNDLTVEGVIKKAILYKLKVYRECGDRLNDYKY